METLQARVSLFAGSLDDNMERVDAMQTAHARAKRPSAELVSELHTARETLLSIELRLRGYGAKRDAGERDIPTIQSRISVGFSGLSTTYGPTELHRVTVATGRAELEALEVELEAFATNVMPGLETALEATSAPPIQN